MKINSLTTTEEDIMQTIWSLSSPYLREIMASIPEPKPHQNTVSTYLKILTEKGYLHPEKEGRVFRYTVKIGKDTYRRAQLLELREKFYNGKSVELISDLPDMDSPKKEPTTEENASLPPVEVQPEIPTPSTYQAEIAQYVEKLVKKQLKASKAAQEKDKAKKTDKKKKKKK